MIFITLSSSLRKYLLMSQFCVLSKNVYQSYYMIALKIMQE